MSIEAAIAMNRFGIGARSGESVMANPQRWLLDQLERYQPAPSALSALPSRAVLIETYRQYQMDKRENKQSLARQMPNLPLPRDGEQAAQNPATQNKLKQRQSNPVRPNPARKEIRNHYSDALEARLHISLTSNEGFAERLVHFWSNHFAVSIDKLPVLAFAGNYEFEAVRPHIMGSFRDLLLATSQHPAMLVYLDQAQSIGPNSQGAQRIAERSDKKRGLNENLAREIMELHTLGARTGYSQGDVTELARALTGLTVPGLGKGPMQKQPQRQSSPGEILFIERLHEPGTRTVMGKSYSQNGAAQATAILADLAVHPATARHIATKLAQHFVADVPPAALVTRLEKSFLKTGGDLPALYRILVEAPESWGATQAKFKTPWEWTVSALRAIDIRDLPSRPPLEAIFAAMGQPVWKPGSPAGYPDLSENWAGGAALMRRVEYAAGFAQRSAGRFDARTLGPQILPGLWSEHSAQWIARAESPEQGLALLLVAPEFLRR